MISQKSALYSSSWLYQQQRGLYQQQNPNFDVVSSKTGAPLKQYAASNGITMNTVSLPHGIPLTRAGGLILAPGQSAMDINVAQLAAATQLLTISGQTPEEISRQSKNKNYKTELCRPYEETGECKYREKCQFAHGVAELRTIARHPKFKTEPCKNFHERGYCAYGTRCHFVHNEPDSKIISPTSPPSHPKLLPVPATTTPFGPPPYSATTFFPTTPSPEESSPIQDHLTIQANFTVGNGGTSLGSAGESPIPSSLGSGSQSPHSSYSPGLASGEDDPFSSGIPPSAPFPTSQQQPRFVYPSPHGETGSDFDIGNQQPSYSVSAEPDVDFLAAGLEDMFSRKYSLEEITAAPRNNGPQQRRLSVFTRLSSSS